MRTSARGLPLRVEPAHLCRAALTALLLIPLLFHGSKAAFAQANTASISITTSFVTASGAPAAAPGGSGAGVSFTLTPTAPAQPPTVLTTNAAGQAFGALSAGSYTFQESTAAPGTSFVSASISQGGAQTQTLSPGVAIPFSPGGSYTIFVTNQVTAQPVSGSATLTIQNTLTTPTGDSAVGLLSGYSFTLAGQNGLPTQTQFTNPLGQATFVNIPAGVYSLSEAPAPGSTFASMTINGVSAQQQQAFEVQAGGNYEVDVTNLAGGSGNLSIQVQLIDQNGNQTLGNLAGYSFTITPQAASTPPITVTTSGTGSAAANLAPGAYSIAETPSPGASLIGYAINGISSPAGQFTVGLGQTTAIAVSNRTVPTSTAVAGGRTVTLQSGCNNVVSTFPDGTPGATLAGGLSTPSGLSGIWKYDNPSQSFRAVYFPAVGSGPAPPVDIPSLNWLDAVFICVAAPATLNEPSP